MFSLLLKDLISDFYSDFGQIIEVKIFVQGRISISVNGSKLLFHLMYNYEISRNILEP